MKTKTVSVLDEVYMIVNKDGVIYAKPDLSAQLAWANALMALTDITGLTRKSLFNKGFRARKVVIGLCDTR